MLTRPFTNAELDHANRAIKRQKPNDETFKSSISDRVASGEYKSLEEVAADVTCAIDAMIKDLSYQKVEEETEVPATTTSTIAQLKRLRTKASDILARERAYPKSAHTTDSDLNADLGAIDSNTGEYVLSILGYAPQERRLFSSLPLRKSDASLQDTGLPPGVSISKVLPTKAQANTHTLGDVFGSARPMPLQPPKQPKTQAKGNTLDFYHPGMSDSQRSRGNNYFATKLASGYYLDYSHATPSSQTVPKQRERAESLAGRKPSTAELAMSEVDSLFRGAFSSFAPTKDDSSAVVPSSVASRVWWQKGGLKSFQRMIESVYGGASEEADKHQHATEVDEKAIKQAIDDWDDSAVDPSLEDAMGSKSEHKDDVDGLLDEVSDLIETLASYQRIRNLTLPSTQNRQSGEPPSADMLTHDVPQPTEEECATYEVLKAQLSLIIKTLPPYAVSKLNGDQLDELLISTKMQIHTDEYSGVMEEDEAGVQARLRAQQAAAQASPRATPQRTNAAAPQHVAQYQASQYGTPGRTPAHQQFYRPQQNAQFQQQRNFTAPSPQRPPQPNQYTRPNGFQSQFATQLAKAQTPYGHQNMQQFAGQQRPTQLQQTPQGTPNARFQYPQGYQQQAGTPTPAGYSGFPNGAGPQQRAMSSQMHQRQPQSPSPNMQQNRFNAAPGPGLTGYHTVISEAQQQRILDQAKARVAAQDRSSSYGGAMGSPGFPMNAMRQGVQTPSGQRMNGAHNLGTPPIPSKVTPVPVPVIPGSQHPGQQ